MSDATITKSIGNAPPGEEVDVARQIRMLWANKLWIFMGTVLVSLLGLYQALKAPPVWQSGAIISLKDSQKSNSASSMLSQLGGLGGRVAAQLGGANTSLDKLEIILNGEDLALSVIETNNLLPKLFPEEWDTANSAWKEKDSARAPNARKGANLLRGSLLSVSVEKLKGVLELGISVYDPVLAKQMADYYLTALNTKLREDARTESATNRGFLEGQLGNTSDPIMREKILTMIAMELEKEMLVGSQSIEVLRRPTVPLIRSKPNRKKILILSIIAGFALSVTVVFLIPFVKRLSSQPHGS